MQASLYELPFRDGQFDYVYCIGVIQHTPDPRKSVLSLLNKVAVGGSVGLWIYELTWKSFVGTMAFKNFLRPWTKRWSIARLERFSDRVERLCWPVLRRARHRGAWGKAVMRLLPAASAHLQSVPLSDADFREWARLDPGTPLGVLASQVALEWPQSSGSVVVGACVTGAVFAVVTAMAGPTRMRE